MASPRSGFLDAMAARSDIVLALGVVGIIGVLIIPIPTGLLDFALAFNITFSLVVLLTTLWVTRPLELSVFPGMLLIVTLMRLALNVASTRLILGQAYAGDVINSFGNFVVQGNYVVGFIIFIILIIIQFVVITKGAGRISEVAARFTLDAMPGKQMAIDADLNAGIISEDAARSRREEIAHEADFYGAMDGASKFVRGDAIAGILITLINIIGGFVIGIALNDMSLGEALRTYSLLSIGDGLVTQIPALLVSTAAGIIVTRSAAKDNMGTDLTGQLTRQPRAIMVAAVVLFAFGMLPGMPTTTFMVLSLAVGGVGYATMQNRKNVKAHAAREQHEKAQKSTTPEERTEDLIKVDALGLEIGYGLIPLVDAKQGGDLLERIATIRKQLASELGIVIPAVRIRDNMQLRPNQYQIRVKGIRIAKYELMPDHVLAINPGFVKEKLDGFDTTDPAFGLKATWIIPNLKEIAEAKNFTVVEPSAVLATHLTEVTRAAAHEITTRQDVQHLLDTLREDCPALVDSIVPEVVPLGTVQKVIKALLRDRIPVRDLATILETMANFIGATQDSDVLAEYVRMALARQITEIYRDKDGKINVFTIDPALEQQLGESVQSTKQGLMLVLDPALADVLLTGLGQEVDKMHQAGFQAICICSPNIRLALRRLAETKYPTLAVISYNEIAPEAEIMSMGMVRLQDDN
ncbi:MAG: flagellar biosynthesis protein FlhA [bacterium]